MEIRERIQRQMDKVISFINKELKEIECKKRRVRHKKYQVVCLECGVLGEFPTRKEALLAPVTHTKKTTVLPSHVPGEPWGLGAHELWIFP